MFSGRKALEMADYHGMDRDTFRGLIDDYIDRYGITEAEIMGDTRPATKEDLGAALVESVRQYLSELDKTDFFAHFGKATARLDALVASLSGSADVLAEASKEYLLEMDRSNLFIHVGDAKRRRDDMRDAIAQYYFTPHRVGHDPGKHSIR